MREYLLTLLVTATVTYLLTPLVRRVATKTGAIHAVRDRDVHLVPTPLMGGLAMYGGLAAGLWVAGQLTPLRTVFEGTGMASGLLLAGGLIVIVGIVDDRWGLNPISKLAGQVAAAAIIVWKGAELNWLPEPGRGTLILTSNQSIALTILVVVATVNAVNFIDGLDGLAAGVICIAAVSFFIYYYALTKAVHVSAEAGPALAAIVLAGACIGFLPHNFHPARIFMGDTGSMLLGLLLAYVPISSISSLDPSTLTNYGGGAVNRFPQILPLIPPAAIMLIPYANLILAIVRRTKAGQPWHAPDRGHLHDRLLDIGHSHRSTVLILYLWAALFSGTVVWLSIANTKVLVFLVTTLAAVLVLLLMSMPRLRWWDRSSRPSAMAGNAVPGAAAGKAVAGAAAGIAPASSAATGAAAVGAAAGPSAAAGSAEGRPAEGRRRGTPPWGSAPAPPGMPARPR